MKKIGNQLFTIGLAIMMLGIFAIRFNDPNQDIDINLVLNAVTLIALIYLGRGYLLSANHKQEDETRDRTMGIQETEIKALQNSNTRLEKELRETSSQCKSDIARLEGGLMEMRIDNERLRALLTGETVSPAMMSAIRGNVAEYEKLHEKLKQYFDERVHSLEQGMDRLLTKNS